jgi:hypothetical protein
MADCTRELVVQAVKALMDAALTAEYGDNYVISRNPAKDPKTVPNGTVFLGMYEGDMPPSDDGNVQAFESFPMLLSVRVAVAAAEGEYLQQRLNNARAIVLAPLKATNIVLSDRSVGMSITNVSRELGLNEAWCDIALTLTFPA